MLLEKKWFQRCINLKKNVCRGKFFIPLPPPENNGPSLSNLLALVFSCTKRCYFEKKIAYRAWTEIANKLSGL